jgi:hypothetical protein
MKKIIFFLVSSNNKLYQEHGVTENAKEKVMAAIKSSFSKQWRSLNPAPQ